MTGTRLSRSTRLLWRTWAFLERVAIAIETWLLRFSDAIGLFQPVGWRERAYHWWFWHGPGRWVVRRANRAEERWPGVRYETRRKRRR